MNTRIKAALLAAAGLALAACGAKQPRVQIQEVLVTDPAIIKELKSCRDALEGCRRTEAECQRDRFESWAVEPGRDK